MKLRYLRKSSVSYKLGSEKQVHRQYPGKASMPQRSSLPCVKYILYRVSSQKHRTQYMCPEYMNIVLDYTEYDMNGKCSSLWVCRVIR